jgi:phosphatidylinositol-3-phosphatase
MGKWYIARTAVQHRFAWLIILSLLLVFAASLTHALIPTAQAQGRTPGKLLAANAPLPRFDHIVVVIEENKDYSEIIGSGTGATYINALAAQGALLTNSHAITHPSQPNYLDLFSGSDQGVNGDACSAQTTYPGPNLGGQIIQAGFSFAGYSEGQPSAGFLGCSDSAQQYARKHNPWANFSDVNGPTTNLPFTSFPTTTAGFSALPTVSFVVPNLNDDMHDGSIQQGDSWLQQHLDSYAQWAKTNNSLLLVTFDEGEELSSTNQIATLFVGQHVQVGSTDAANISHYDVLRTLEDMYGLTPANNAATATDITGIWN